MPTYVDARREAARAFFQSLDRALRADEALSDKQCVRLIIEKARSEHASQSRKRFDPESTFRTRLLYGTIDDAIAAWCQRRDLKTDPFMVFRYEGPERGPTQHESAVGLARPVIERAFDRLAERVPQLTDCRAVVFKAPTKVISPGFRLQHPLPFGAAGEVKYGGTYKDLERLVYQVAMYAATGGDAARGWRYDCGLLVFFCTEHPRMLLGEAVYDAWPDLQERVWEAARVWIILI